MLTIVWCDLNCWRLLPAWGSNAAGWQFHWLMLYLEWRRDA